MDDTTTTDADDSIPTLSIAFVVPVAFMTGYLWAEYMSLGFAGTLSSALIASGIIALGIRYSEPPEGNHGL